MALKITIADERGPAIGMSIAQLGASGIGKTSLREILERGAIVDLEAWPDVPTHQGGE